MKKEKGTPKDAGLRRRAEERLTGKKTEKDHLPAEEDARRIVHELQVHQVELELQNEELIRTREELEKQLEKYSDLYNFAPVGYFTLDERGAILEANLTSAKLLGIDRSRMKGRRFGSFLSDESRPGFDACLRESCEGTAADTCEVALGADRHRYLQLEVTAVESGEGTIRQCRMAAMDITARKQAEERLREYEKVVESSKDMITVMDRSYRYLLANAAFLKYRRLNREQVVGRSAPEVFGADVFESRVKKYLDASFRGETVHYEMKYNYPGLGEREVFVSYFPIRDASGVTGVASITQDVTELRQMERALRQAHDGLELRVRERTAELERAYEALRVETEQRQSAEADLRQAQKIEAVGMLAGGIAHDFNNILAAIIGFAELAKDETPEGSPARRYMEGVFIAGIRGRDLVKQILTFSRQAEQEKRPLQLVTVVKETLKFLRPSLPTTMDIGTNLQSETGFVLADSIQMQQIVMNLCTNAAHAMRGTGGKISIDLSDYSFSSPKDAPDPAMSPGLYMRLSVSDTGEGMSSETLHRIFDPFFTTKPHGEGTGLGLSVVYSIVRSHGGTITVSSKPGKGSSFTVYLPKHREDGARDSTGGDGAIPRGHERVLFIDDEKDIALIGDQMLTGLGYHVTSRTSSVEALALFRLNPSDFDVVVTDQTMPELSGVELAKEILTMRPDMPIVMCTGFSHVVDAAFAKAAGIRAFAVKPLSKKEIAQTIRRVLDRET